MSHQRGASTVDQVKEPHPVSLKVLRLSRPSLSIQHPLPLPTPASSPNDSPATFPPPSASLAYPSPSPSGFILSPLLTLPPAFGSAYVGETFSCTLCANNEVLEGSLGAGGKGGKVITNVRIEAEMKVPSSGIPIVLALGPESASQDDEEGEEGDESETSDEAEGKEKIAEIPTGVDLAPAKSLQKIVNFALKEEGSHVLAVTVTYSETTATSGRIRTFRKLYQFVCKGCMVVRTKTGVLPSTSLSPAAPGPKIWALEAQLENTGEEIITLDMVRLETNPGFKAQGVNWEVVIEGKGIERPVLTPGDVYQVAFVVEEDFDGEGEGERRGPEPIDGRWVFGVLSLGWRGGMGNRGFLSTGSLGARVR